MMRFLYTLLLALCVTAAAARTGLAAKQNVEILRDKYAIPHIFADSPEAAMYGLGWAEAQDGAYDYVFSIISARGRLAEFFQESADLLNLSLVQSDIQSLALGYYELAGQWRSLPEDIQTQLVAFAAGFNDYLEQAKASGTFDKRFFAIGGADRGAILRAFGPITPQDIVALELFMNGEGALRNMTVEELDTRGQRAYESILQKGSNAMGIGPDLVREHVSMVYGDLHNPWTGAQHMAHIQTPDKTVFGLFTGPFFMAGRGGHVGIAFTRNKPDAADIFMEKIHPEKFDMYQVGDDWIPMQRKKITVKIRHMKDLPVTLYFTRHGWVWNYPPSPDTHEYGYALQVSVLDTTMDPDAPIKFITKRLRLPWLDSVYDHYHLNREPLYSMRNFVLGDDYGNISNLWVGRVPVRHGDINPLHTADSSAPVPGWTLINDWTNGVWMLGDPDFQLPYYLNPRGGVVRSANDAPWYAAGCDPAPKRPAWMPFHVVPEHVDSTPRGMLMRELSCTRSIRSLDDVRAKLAFNTLSIDSLHFIQALDRGWQMYAQDLGAVKLSDDVKRLDRMLRNWNARADRDQPAMTAMFILRRNTSLPWFPENYTPTLSEMLIYLKDLAITADNLRVFYKDIQVPWGDVHFMIINGRRIPLPGGTANIQTLFMASMGSFPEPGDVERDEVFGDNRAYAETNADLRGRVVCDFGSSFIHAHVMDPRNPASYAITPQGQLDAAAFPDSPHIFQQAELFSKGEWMRIPLTRKEVEQNLDPWGENPGHEHPTRSAFSVDPAALFRQSTSGN